MEKYSDSAQNCYSLKSYSMQKNSTILIKNNYAIDYTSKD